MESHVTQNRKSHKDQLNPTLGVNNTFQISAQVAKIQNF